MLLLFIVITLFVLAVIWYYPSTSYKENYAPTTRGGPMQKGGMPPKSGLMSGGPLGKKGPSGPQGKSGPSGPQGKSGPGGTLTPETLVTIPLGILIQYLDKSGAGSVSN